MIANKIHCFPVIVNGIGEDVGGTVMTGKVIRPIRSVDPSQTEYQGLVEFSEEGWCHIMTTHLNSLFVESKIDSSPFNFQVDQKCRIIHLES